MLHKKLTDLGVAGIEPANTPFSLGGRQPRVVPKPVQAYSVRLPIEPLSYTRLVQGSRWKTGYTAQKKYLDWKDQVQNLFETKDYFQPDSGLPFVEPLAVQGTFRVPGPVWGTRDLDNLLKGAVDALNPSTHAGWAKFRIFTWLDDRQIKLASARTFPRDVGEILLDVYPLWGRLDPDVPFLYGRPFFSELPLRGCVAFSSMAVPVGHNYYFVLELTPLELQRTQNGDPSWEDATQGVVVYPWPAHQNGVYRAFLSLDGWLLYRQATRLSGVNPELVWELLGLVPIEEVRHALWGGGAVSALPIPEGFQEKRARKQLALLAETLAPSPVAVLLHEQIYFRPAPFERTAVALTRVTQQPWGLVRRWLLDQRIDWRGMTDAVSIAGLLAPAVPVFEKKKERQRTS